MRPFSFLMVIHSHQPVGNEEYVIRAAFQNAYLPFLRLLEQHPEIVVTLHYSGILLEWLQAKHPESIDLLRKLIASGQVELLTGGYYEPIMGAIPDRDKVGQIRKLTSTIFGLTGYRPRGMWLAERAWEPSLPVPLSRAGVEYTTLDSEHFLKAGYLEEEIGGYFITEDGGSTLKLFGGRERLRYLIPFKPVEDVVNYLMELSKRPGARSAVYANDGEKFGVWPGTHSLVYEKGWLKRFFGLLIRHKDRIQTTTLAQFLDGNPPEGRIYIPTCTYPEMAPWSLPARAGTALEVAAKAYPQLKPLFQGGFWKSFLTKYQEANDLHKKMLRVSDKIGKLEEEQFPVPLELKDELYRGQCNDPYWHGVFGGLQLPHLRNAVYSHLIRAERVADGLLQMSRDYFLLKREDINKDGRDEIEASSPHACFCFAPGEGGSLYELDYRPRAFNVLSTLTRRKEAYHYALEAEASSPSKKAESTTTIHDQKLGGEALKGKLVFDRYRRASFLDHFLADGVTLTDFSASSYVESGDYVSAPYQVTILDEKEGSLGLKRRGRVAVGARSVPVELEKEFRVSGSEARVACRYRIKNRGGQKLSCYFGIEFNIGLEAGWAKDRYYRVSGVNLSAQNLASTGEVERVKEVQLVDEYRRIVVALTTSEEAVLWRFPIITLSRSERGLEEVFQSSCLVPRFRIWLAPGKAFEVVVGLAVWEM